MCRNMPFLLALMILGCLLCDPWIPVPLKSFLYALSLTIKSFIVFLLPVIIFSLLFKTTAQLAHQATKILLVILAAVCCSNFTATFLSQYVGAWITHFDLTLISPQQSDGLIPLWTFQLSPWIANDKALFISLGAGLLLSYWRPQMAVAIGENLGKMVDGLLALITTILPLFIVGFILKLQHDQVLARLAKDYGLIFLVIAGAQFSYILLIYFMANRLNGREGWNSFKNMLPAAIAGFSTMSSATAMPLTIKGTEKNTSTSIGRSVIPTTVNIHLLGDCFAIPILAYAILKSYGLAEPALMDYLIFAGYFVLAKFSVAALPGGGILVMLPVLERYLGFNAEMMSLITALYILFDPVITCTNVLGNGGLAIILDRLAKRKTLRRPRAQEGFVE